MNVKNNKRRRASVERIEKAFIGLLQTNELHTITVSDICKNAEINRSTFYANYIDIYDLADKIKEHLESEFHLLFADRNNNSARNNDAVKMFGHIKENQLFYKTYFKLGHHNNHEILIYNVQEAEKFFGSKYVNYHIEFFKCGLNAIIKMWLDNNCKETPEEMAEIIRSEYQGRF